MSSDNSKGQTQQTPTLQKAENNLAALAGTGRWQQERPLRLHLGCGEQYFEDYINIDYPPDHHNVMTVKADAFADLLCFEMPGEVVDEIRLHHVFEHFNRVTALGMLIKWHSWLKNGGLLRIETPDLAGSARTLASKTSSWKMKMAAVRHLAGDQAAAWGYHLDHWFPERFEKTLKRLGFGSIKTHSTSWPHEPHLANVEVTSLKLPRSRAQQLEAADELLWESAVADVERPTFEVWARQLRAFLEGSRPESPSNASEPDIAKVSIADAKIPPPRSRKTGGIMRAIFSRR